MAFAHETGVESLPCPNNPDPSRPDADLTWLLHRAAHQLRSALEEVARRHGLGGLRDYIVLTVLGSGEPRTQLALGKEVGIDKTTLTALIDRLERDGLVTRRIDPDNRRVRFPETTAAGKAIQAKVAEARPGLEAKALAMLADEEQAALRSLLLRLVSANARDGQPLAGSSM